MNATYEFPVTSTIGQIQASKSLTDNAATMLRGNFSLDDNIVADGFPRSAYQAGKIAAY